MASKREFEFLAVGLALLADRLRVLAEVHALLNDSLAAVGVLRTTVEVIVVDVGEKQVGDGSVGNSELVSANVLRALSGELLLVEGHDGRDDGLVVLEGLVVVILLHLVGVELGDEVLCVVDDGVDLRSGEAVLGVVSVLGSDQTQNRLRLVELLAVLVPHWQLSVDELASGLARSERFEGQLLISVRDVAVAQEHTDMAGSAVDGEVAKFGIAHWKIEFSLKLIKLRCTGSASPPHFPSLCWLSS